MPHYIPTEPELSHVGGNWIGGNPMTYYPQLWEWMVKWLAVRSVLDVGCGEGHALATFQELGCTVFGIDGAPRNVEITKSKGIPAVVHDLTKSAYIHYPLPELVWCCEVVGQIDKQYITNVLATLTQGTYLAMTNELPGQVGHHHVNLKPTSYWMQHLMQYGFHPIFDTHEPVEHSFWVKTGVIYKRVAK